MITLAAMLKGMASAACCCAGSSADTARMLRGRLIVLDRKPNSTTAATASGAT